MVAQKTSKDPLGYLRPQAEYPVEWEEVEEKATPQFSGFIDTHGLTPDDRAALGLTHEPVPGSMDTDEDAVDALDRILE